MTDSEIVKALECCASGEIEECKNCPYVEGYPYCDGPMERDVLDLINRLQAEKKELVGNIDRLKAELFDKTEQLKTAKAKALKEAASKFAGHSDYHGDTILCKLICMAEGKEVKSARPLDKSEIKSKAYKEFAERLKSHTRKMSSSDFSGEFWDKAVLVADIDNLLKELVGEDK